MGEQKSNETAPPACEWMEIRNGKSRRAASGLEHLSRSLAFSGPRIHWSQEKRSNDRDGGQWTHAPLQ